MSYKVHRLEINVDKDHAQLEQFLNNLHGEVVSIIPMRPHSALSYRPRASEAIQPALTTATLT